MLQLVRTQHKLPMPDHSNGAEDEYGLLARISQGDTSAFEAFYKAYYPRLFRFILRMTQQTDVVEELIQETLLVVWEKPESFNHTSKISTWVLGIAYNKTLKLLSKAAKRNQDLDMDDWLELIDDPTANLAQNNENQDWLNCALATLSPEHRAVIELTFYHDLSYQEIARILDCPENTVKTRMFHARKKLQVFAATHES
jgi:RNA polymerase sigma-70 factor (ECF subfamily)